MADNLLRITDVTLSTGRQPSLATWLQPEEIEAIAREMDRAGFHAAEVWGGDTFNAATRYFHEEPWQRPQLLKRLMPNTPLQMVIGGQNLVGNYLYPDDVVSAFIFRAAEAGIDIFRVYDALNDERNLDTCLKAIKECGKEAQLAICYSVNGSKLGGEPYTVQYYLDKARLLQDMGADSLCIEDMTGLITPDDAYELIQALKQALKIPLWLHTGVGGGLAAMSLLKAIEAGVDGIDAAISPAEPVTIQPAMEPVVTMLHGTLRDTGLDLGKLVALAESIRSLIARYREWLGGDGGVTVDTGLLQYQVPRGIISSLAEKLRKANAEGRIDQVYTEICQVSAEMGYPPLVPPIDMVIGTQAMQNVLYGRYKVISEEMQEYVYGLYGRPPAPIDVQIQKTVIKGYPRGETPLDCRAAEALKPEMDKAYEATRGVGKDIGDVLMYALYPESGMRFLRWKYGMEAAPAVDRPRPAPTEPISQILTSGTLEKGIASRPGVRAYKLYIGNRVYNIGVEVVGGPPLPAALAETAAVPPPTVVAEVVKEAPAVVPEITPGVIPEYETPALAVVAKVGETAVKAPMPGEIIGYEVAIGDEVNIGDTIVILEAMKMDIEIPSPVSGTVKALNFRSGDRVAKDAILAVIG